MHLVHGVWGDLGRLEWSIFSNYIFLNYFKSIYKINRVPPTLTLSFGWPIYGKKKNTWIGDKSFIISGFLDIINSMLNAFNLIQQKKSKIERENQLYHSWLIGLFTKSLKFRGHIDKVSPRHCSQDVGLSFIKLHLI